MDDASKPVAIDPNGPIKRQSIAGYVTLKRKAYWVKRYAQIKDSMFQYAKDNSKFIFSHMRSLDYLSHF